MRIIVTAVSFRTCKLFLWEILGYFCYISSNMSPIPVINTSSAVVVHEATYLTGKHLNFLYATERNALRYNWTVYCFSAAVYFGFMGMCIHGFWLWFLLLVFGTGICLHWLCFGNLVWKMSRGTLGVTAAQEKMCHLFSVFIDVKKEVRPFFSI